LRVASQCRRRIGLVVLVDHVDGPAEDPAAGVYLLDGQVDAELRLGAVKLDAARERQDRADLDRLGGGCAC
jgi:hypothetical protein